MAGRTKAGGTGTGCAGAFATIAASYSHESLLSSSSPYMLLSMNRRSGAHCIELTTEAGGLVLKSAHESARRRGLRRLVHARVGTMERLAAQRVPGGRKRGRAGRGQEDQFYRILQIQGLELGDMRWTNF